MDPTDIQDLLRYVQEARTCGENLEYDPEFIELERIGWCGWKRLENANAPARQPNWDDVLERCKALFARTLDIRLAVVLVRAALHVRGCNALRPLLQLLGSLITTHWEGVYPERVPEDDPEDWRRRSALAALADPSTVLADLRAARLWHGVAGVTVRDMEVAFGSDTALAGETLMPYDEVCQTLREGEQAPGELKKLLDVDAAAHAVAHSIEERLGGIPDLRPLLAITGSFSRAIRGVLREPVELGVAVVSEDDTRTLSPEQKAQALGHVGDVAAWLAAEGLKERFPALFWRAQRLKDFNELAAHLQAGPDAPETPLSDIRGHK